MEDSFGKRLSLIRKEKKMSQATLGRLIGHGGERISQFESGRREPSISELVKLCYALDISADALLGVSSIRPNYY